MTITIVMKMADSNDQGNDDGETYNVGAASVIMHTIISMEATFFMTLVCTQYTRHVYTVATGR